MLFIYCFLGLLWVGFLVFIWDVIGYIGFWDVNVIWDVVIVKRVVERVMGGNFGG